MVNVCLRVVTARSAWVLKTNDFDPPFNSDMINMSVFAYILPGPFSNWDKLIVCG